MDLGVLPLLLTYLNWVSSEIIRTGGSYLCQYFSDATYNCYTASRNAGTNELASPGQQDLFSLAGLGAPVKGPWDTKDGFLTLPENGTAMNRTYIGTCLFPCEFVDDMERDMHYMIHIQSGKGYECKQTNSSCQNNACLTPPKKGPNLWTGSIGGRIKVHPGFVSSDFFPGMTPFD